MFRSAFGYGKQVVSWGESTFIPGGINVINPVDVPAFRAPGSELKDALLPVEMFYMSAGITENVTVETFVQADWEPVRPDDCGTFFSTNDSQLMVAARYFSLASYRIPRPLHRASSRLGLETRKRIPKTSLVWPCAGMYLS